MINKTLNNMPPDIICFCHLRWNFVYQRPQHLMTRHIGRVFFFEEPVFNSTIPYNEITHSSQSPHVWVVTPHLPPGEPEQSVATLLGKLLDQVISDMQISRYISWYYSPMAWQFSRHLHPLLIVYDCMDELSAFRFAPSSLREHERILMANADLVFTGGHSLYESKRSLHSFVYAFPSSIDKHHFTKARERCSDPWDQALIRHPRIGYCGVIDERLDLELIHRVAELRRQWQLVFVGPVVKIDPDVLPVRDNIHYLGAKNYSQLPTYLSGWDVAMMPFAMNESTAFISPTKTPEYLCAGRRVVSTPVTDVVRDYGRKDLVSIVATAEEFVRETEQLLSAPADPFWLERVDEELSSNSWDLTWSRMTSLMEKAMENKTKVTMMTRDVAVTGN